MIGDWAFRARNTAREPEQFIQYSTLTLVERFNVPDGLQITGRTDDLRPLLTTRGGCTLADDTGTRRFSGPLTQIVRRGNGTCVLTFASDLIWLWARLAYPDPTRPITGQTAAYDRRTGPAETVMLGLIQDNAGPAALAVRRVPGLTIPASAGRGGLMPRAVRLDVLGPLVAQIAEAASLRVRVLQGAGSTSLGVVVTGAPDLSATARYGPATAGGPGLIDDSWEYTIDRATVTTAIVAGGGEGTARIFRERTAVDATLLWGRIESLTDQRQTSDVDELDQAGADALVEGSNPVEIRATILDSPDLRIGIDVPVGALVSLDLDGERVVDRLRQVTTTISQQGGSPTIQIDPVVGSPDAPLTRDQSEFLRTTRQLRKVLSR